MIHKSLRRNPPAGDRVTSGQKLCTEIIYIVLQNFCATVLNVSKKSFLTTPNVENKFWSSYATLESSGEMKLMMKFYLCLHNFSELWNLFSRVPMGNYVWCYSGKYANRTVIYLKLFCYKVFVHQKLKLLDFLSDFVLNFVTR